MNQKHWTVTEAAAGTPLLDFLAGALDLSKRKAKDLLDARTVFVNDRRVWMARHPLRTGDRVQVTAPAKAVDTAPIPLLYQDDQIVVVNKPAGRVSNGPDSVETILRRTLNCPHLAAVHRLDRDTTGCLIFARDGSQVERLVQGFRDQAVTKVYRAILRGTPTANQGTLTQPVDGKRALTRYQVMGRGPLASQVRVQLETGRTHQIRKHFAASGHPVAGDSVYGTSAAIRDPVLKALPRQMLHAESVRFRHPAHGKPVAARAAVPEDFRLALRQLAIH